MEFRGVEYIISIFILDNYSHTRLYQVGYIILYFTEYSTSTGRYFIAKIYTEIWNPNTDLLSRLLTISCHGISIPSRVYLLRSFFSS